MILLNWSKFRFCRNGTQSKAKKIGIICKYKHRGRQAGMHACETYTYRDKVLYNVYIHTRLTIMNAQLKMVSIWYIGSNSKRYNGSVGQFLRPCQLDVHCTLWKYTHTHLHTYQQALKSINPIPPQPHSKGEHVQLLNFTQKHEFCFKLLIVCRIHLFS